MGRGIPPAFFLSAPRGGKAMKCGPDGCPIVAFSDLTPAEQRVQRKRYAAKMVEQGFSEQQIATQLGVSQATISGDLGSLSGIDKLPPRTSKRGRKGEGRPKGRKGKSVPDSKAAQIGEALRPQIMAGKPISQIEWAERFDVSTNTVQRAVLQERARLEVIPEITPETLSMSAQQKLDAAIRQHKNKLDMEFEIRCREECIRWLNEVSLPQYLKEISKLEHLIRNREGVMDRITYRKILACLHPDRVQDPALKKRYEEAFRLFTDLEKRVLDEKQSPTAFRTMPRSYEDLMKMKAKVQAERRAKRGTKSAVGMR
jgi:transposase